MSKDKSRHLTHVALIAAAYTALSVALSPMSFGAVQVRASEALCLLPVICASSVYGVTLGCMLTNIVGIATGASILGVMDVVLGTLATLCAAIMTRALRNVRFGNIPFLSSLPPVLFNGVVVGAELAYVMAPNSKFLPTFISCAASVAVGEFLSCSVLGLILLRALESNKSALAFFQD